MSSYQRRSETMTARIEQGIDRLYERVFHEQTNDQARPYLAVLDRVHQYVVPRTYVEVGVSVGQSLSLALPGTVCVGIDPKPRIRLPLPPSTAIYAMTSDDFFASVHLPEALEGRPIDLAFIDGMHRFEFALRDFMHLEQFAAANTTVLVHDCLPPDEASASRERTPPHWTGDVWKTIACLRAWRPDLQVSVADVGPTGLGVISQLDPTSTVLQDHYDEIWSEYLAMPYAAYSEADKGELLGLVPGDWEHVRGLLPVEPFRDDDVTMLKARRLLRALPPALRRWAGLRVRLASRRLGIAGG